MKKLFVLFALLAFTSGVSFAADTYTGSMVEKYTSGIVKKEQQLREDAAAKQQAREEKKAEFQKKMEADRAAREAKQAETNKKIQEKKDAWNTLIGK